MPQGPKVDSPGAPRKIRLTRRQSQRPSLSRLVLSKVYPKEEYGPINLLLHEPRQRRSWLIFDGKSMKTNITWFCISVAALIIGMQLAKKEVRIIEKPVEIVKTKEVFVDRPVERVKEVPKEGEKIVAQKLSSPPVDKRNSVVERARLHQRYDPFLTQLGLTLAQMDRFVELKLAIYEAQDDLQAAVEQNGVRGGTAEVEAMRTQLTKPMWDEIRQLFGSDGFKDYGDYERTSAVRPTVDGLFRAAGVSVSDQQADQVTRLVIKNTEIYRAKATDISSRARIDWSAIAREAESVLTPVQVEAIKAKAARDTPR